MKKIHFFTIIIFLVLIINCFGISLSAKILVQNKKYDFTSDFPIINGPNKCIIGKSYDYSFCYYHPNGNDVFYRIYWGDCMALYAVGPHKSGEEITLSHTWCKLCCEAGVTTMFAFAFDEYGHRSDMAAFKVNLRHGVIFSPLFILFNK